MIACLVGFRENSVFGKQRPRWPQRFFCALALCFLTTTAKAQSASAPSWDGFYVGANVGLRATQSKWTGLDFFGPPVPGLESQTFNDAAFRYGFYAGYNWQFAPRWVAGIEGEWGDAQKTRTQPGFLPGFSGIFFGIVPGDTVSVQTNWDAGLRGRIGYLVTPSTLLYATGGAAWQDFKITSVCGPSDCGSETPASAHTTQVGWMAGGGIEKMLAGNWLARAEYRYADFGTSRETLHFGAPIFGTATVDLKLATSTYVFGLAYRFGGKAPSAPQPVAEVPRWSGPYLGLAAGARSREFKWTTVVGGPFPILPGVGYEWYNDTEFRGGVFAGYNWQFAERFVAGIEGDWGTSNHTTTQYGALPGVDGVFGPIDPGDMIRVKTSWDTSARGRIGYLVDPSLLIYGTGGIAWQHLQVVEACGPLTCGATTSATDTIMAQGWTYGGGIEAAVGGGWRLRAEYRFADYGTMRENFSAPLLQVPTIADLMLKTQLVQFGASYVFN